MLNITSSCSTLFLSFLTVVLPSRHAPNGSTSQACKYNILVSQLSSVEPICETPKPYKELTLKIQVPVKPPTK